MFGRAPSQAGRAYLIGRAVHYAREEEVVRGLAAVMERLRGALGGLAKRIETDCGASADRSLGSLYFLVKREAVESFRQAFRRIERAEPATLLLSGPWAPYNFVAIERLPREGGSLCARPKVAATPPPSGSRS